MNPTTFAITAEGDSVCPKCEGILMPRDRVFSLGEFNEAVSSHRCPDVCALYEIDPFEAEPAPGSVVMIFGCTGTSYQRLHSTGRWHSAVSGDGIDYEDLLALDRSGRPPLLLHDSTVHEGH